MRNNVPLTVHNKVKAAGILPGVVADILKKLFINADDNNSQLLIQILIINNPVGYVKEIILAVIGFLCLSGGKYMRLIVFGHFLIQLLPAYSKIIHPGTLRGGTGQKVVEYHITVLCENRDGFDIFLGIKQSVQRPAQLAAAD